MEFVDWNEFTLDQHCEILEEKFRFSSAGEAKSIFELIKFYKEHKVKEISSKVRVTGQLPDCESRGVMHIIDLNIKKCIECGKDYTGNLQ